MKQQIALVTIGVNSIDRSKLFYVEGFGWQTIYEDADSVMYQMNGFVLSTWLKNMMREDTRRPNLSTDPSNFTLAHVVGLPEEVQRTLKHLSEYGGKILRPAGAPKQGGVRGYISDPDDNIWEIIWNPIWTSDQHGRFTIKSNSHEGQV